MNKHFFKPLDEKILSSPFCPLFIYHSYDKFFNSNIGLELSIVEWWLYTTKKSLSKKRKKRFCFELCYDLIAGNLNLTVFQLMKWRQSFLLVLTTDFDPIFILLQRLLIVTNSKNSYQNEFIMDQGKYLLVDPH